jgi:hypothetical protein
MICVRPRLIVEVSRSERYRCELAECDLFHSRKICSYTLPDGTPTPELEVGDVFVREHDAGFCHWGWDDCDGKHVIVVTPHAHQWDVHSRANNCTMLEDRRHRCWILHGELARPETLHVDKSGVTCSAGAGSIGTGRWHGFLDRGYLCESRGGHPHP